MSYVRGLFLRSTFAATAPRSAVAELGVVRRFCVSPVNESYSTSPRGWSALPKVFATALWVWLPLVILALISWPIRVFVAYGNAMSAFGPHSAGAPVPQQSAPPDTLLSLWAFPVTLPGFVMSLFHLPPGALPFVWAVHLFLFAFVFALFRHRRIVFR